MFVCDDPQMENHGVNVRWLSLTQSTTDRV